MANNPTSGEFRNPFDIIQKYKQQAHEDLRKRQSQEQERAYQEAALKLRKDELKFQESQFKFQQLESQLKPLREAGYEATPSQEGQPLGQEDLQSIYQTILGQAGAIGGPPEGFSTLAGTSVAKRPTAQFKSTDFYSDRVQFHLSQGLPLGEAQLKAKQEDQKFSVETAQGKRQEDIIKKGQLATLKGQADDDAITLIRNTKQEYAINPLGVDPPPSIPDTLIAQVADSLFQARVAASGLLTDEDLKEELGGLRKKQKNKPVNVVDITKKK